MGEQQGLQAEYQRLNTQAQGIVAEFKGREHEMPEERMEELTGVLGRIDEMKARMDVLKRAADAKAFGEEPSTGAVSMSYREAAPGEGDVEYDVQAWRSVKVDTPIGQREIRYHVPEAVQVKGYSSAFEAYLRDGKAGLGPNDRKTLLEGTDSAGGFLVPDHFVDQILKKMATMAAIRPLARVMTTSRDNVQMPRINYTTDDQYTSGVRLSWVGENPTSSAHRVTDPVFGLVNIPVHTAMASLPMSLDLIEDSAVDVLGIAGDLFGEAFALGEDNVFINGTGIGRPEGLLQNVDATNGIESVLSGTDGELTTSGDAHGGERIVNLFYEVPAQYRQAAVWLMNSGTMNEVEKLVDSQKRPLVGPLTGISLASGSPDQIKGRPVNVDEFMPDLATDDYPILFGDLSGYTIVDRVGLSVQRLNERYAEENLTVLLARRRVGGAVTEPYRMRVLKAGD